MADRTLGLLSVNTTTVGDQPTAFRLPTATCCQVQHTDSPLCLVDSVLPVKHAPPVYLPIRAADRRATCQAPTNPPKTAPAPFPLMRACMHFLVTPAWIWSLMIHR
uniref:Uncharacterized protein n=1 Tax=Eutreptiella gymnastica TaxID=73025 RepID=A0A7S4FHB5_9EUGL